MQITERKIFVTEFKKYLKAIWNEYESQIGKNY